jgi:colanic acid biosynthesis protein WcaH
MEDKERFIELIRALPLVSVDLVLVRDGREVLLGLRTNRPAQGSWFVPGGRILKNEKRADASPGWPRGAGHRRHPRACRPFSAPLSISTTTALPATSACTHYVVLGHRIDVPAGFEIPGCDDQHEALRWWPIEDAWAATRCTASPGITCPC